jgi:hypothetical protein
MCCVCVHAKVCPYSGVVTIQKNKHRTLRLRTPKFPPEKGADESRLPTPQPSHVVKSIPTSPPIQYVASSTMPYCVGRKYGQIEQGYFLEW